MPNAIELTIFYFTSKILEIWFLSQHYMKTRILCFSTTRRIDSRQITVLCDKRA
jgi:hypothetical protein